MTDHDVPIGWLLLMGILLCVAGALLALIYCDYRRTQDFQLTQQLASLGERCVTTLGEVTPGAIVLAQQARPRPVPLQVRDSLRERRWTTAP